MELLPMYQALTNSPDTAITGDISAESTYITVMSASAVPPELPNLMTLGKTDTAETVRVLELNDNTLTVERGVDGLARAWKAGTVIARRYSALEHNNMIGNVVVLQNNKIDRDDVYTKVDADKLLAGKANATDVYTKPEADDLLAGKASLVNGKVPMEQLPGLTAAEVPIAPIAGLDAGTVQGAIQQNEERFTESNLTLLNGWKVAYTGSYIPRISKSGKIVVIDGIITGGTNTNGTIICMLPNYAVDTTTPKWIYLVTGGSILITGNKLTVYDSLSANARLYISYTIS